MQPSGVRMAFQCTLTCLFYAWTYKTDLFKSELLQTTIEMAMGLLGQQNKGLHDANLSHLLQALKSLYTRSIEFVDSSSILSETSEIVLSDDFSSWPSLL